MKSRNEENLKDLFGKFLNSEEAKQIEQDIRKGEQILREHPAPAPDGEVIADIKAEIGRAVLRRKANVFTRTVYKAAVVAAAVIILTAISVKLFKKGVGKPERPATASIIAEAIWESERLAADDADLAILTAEIEQIESEVLGLQLGENGGNGYEAVTELETELEMELIEINRNFWKG